MFKMEMPGIELGIFYLVINADHLVREPGHWVVLWNVNRNLKYTDPTSYGHTVNRNAIISTLLLKSAVL